MPCDFSERSFRTRNDGFAAVLGPRCDNLSGAYDRDKSVAGASKTEMRRPVTAVLYVLAMAAIIVAVDFMFFRNRFWERLTVNIGIVLVFAAFYLRFLKRP